MAAVELLAAILAGTPKLPGAACRERVALFDRAADGGREAAEAAMAVCGQCPALDACREWMARAHPTRPPPGVWAGQYQPPARKRVKSA